MRAGTFDSASGLRPMSAFVVIAAVLGTVAAWVPWLGARRAAAQPERLVVERGSAPDFTILDRAGNPIACSVPRFDLEMSPRSMWQTHTPDYMALRISERLGGDPAPAELLERMLPADEDGWVEVAAWDLDARRAHRLGRWIAGDEERRPLPGIRVVPLDGSGARFRVLWNPTVLLARDLRESHGVPTAAAWGRRIADGFARSLRGPDEPLLKTARQFAQARERVWKALFPSAHTRPVTGMPQDYALSLRELFEDEGVSPWQMKIAYARDRVYPCGEHELFGSWGFPDEQATEPEPVSGLELAAARILCDDSLDVDAEGEVYRWRRDRNVRGARAHCFDGYQPADAAPVVRTTMDLALQSFVGETLQAVMDEHRPALAMGIAVDVETGDVLAVDGAEGYEISPFAPIYHSFTPGSTFKVVTMAAALEEGVVTPASRFDVGPKDHYRLVVDRGPGRKPQVRIIHEAEGSLGGEISAAEALAWSVNAGLVQIGLRVTDEAFRGYLVRLGYGSAPRSGLGVEKRGHLAQLPWKRTYTHASVSFGHELTTTLWQHASALATVVRGGVHRPLRLFASIEQEGDLFPLGLAEGSRVFSERTCGEVRAMMRLGAEEGTGAPVLERMKNEPRWHNAALALRRADVSLGTKTATAQKVGREICLHVELGARERWEASGTPVTKARYESLRSVGKPHRDCYTSSMCVFGRSPVTDREVMVLVVVDEPRGEDRFGSKVAGPAAFAILAEALELTRGGELFTETRAGGFVAVHRDATGGGA